MLPRNASKPMNAIVERNLHEKFRILKDLAMNTKSFGTTKIEQILTPESLYKIKVI